MVMSSLLLARPALAVEPTCPIVLDDTQAEGWDTAVSTAAARLSALAQHSPVDCRSIEVHPNREPPEVVLVTGDGRRAIRSIAGPEELWPTIDALAITFRVAPEPLAPVTPSEPPVVGPPPSTQQSEAHAPTRPLPAPDTEPAAPPAEPRLAALAIAGHFGFRAGHGKVTPLILGEGELRFDGWEFSAGAQWETRYVGLNDELEDGLTATGAGARAAIGRQWIRSRSVTLSAGLSAALAALELRYSKVEGQPENDDALETRLGAYASARIPGQGRAGFQLSVMGEWVPESLESNPGSGLPNFALTGAIGFDGEIL